MDSGSGSISRRHMLAAAAVGSLAAATLTEAGGQPVPEPRRPGMGGSNPGPINPALARQNPDIMAPPATDSGTLPNLRFSFDDSHMRLDRGGWARQITARELAISKNIAGVNMRLNSGGVRELHWHTAAEWSFMLTGTARITAVDAEGRNFVDDVGPGDLWYFPAGIPHSIQGLAPDGCEFLLVFDDGNFDEDGTFLLSDWIKHIPPDVLAKNFGVPASTFANVPDPSQLYMFPAPLPGPLAADRMPGVPTVPRSFSHRMMAQTPIATKSGTVRITDSKVFPASTAIAAALVEVAPGGMRELHWHPNAAEWQYYIEGQARMGVFASSGRARTFDFRANDVGYVPFAMGHYIENTGSTTLRFLEIFKSDHYADVSLDQWLALTPPELVTAHLRTDPQFIRALRKTKAPVVPA